MKIVHIINNLEIGGGAQALVKDIIKYGKYDHKVITLEKPSLHFAEIEQLSLLRNPIKSINHIFNSDLIHFHLFPSLYLAPIFFLKKKIFTEHNTFNRRRKYKIFKYIDSFFYSFFIKIFCISDGTKKTLSDWLIGKHFTSKFEVIYNGVDFSAFKKNDNRFSNSRKKYHNNENIVIGMVGSFTDQKNQKFLLEVLADLPINYSLRFAGSGKTFESIQNYSNQICLKERVQFCGLISDIPSFYDDLDIYVHAAHWEGFGLTIIEAIASGLPVLASNVSGLKEIIEPSYLFNNDDKSNLVKLIENIFIDKKLIDMENLYKNSKEAFDITIMVKKYESQYKLIKNG